MSLFHKDDDWPSGTSWSFTSKKDPRFNMSGYIGYPSLWGATADAEKALETKKKELGCEPPDDLEISVMKD